MPTKRYILFQSSAPNLQQRVLFSTISLDADSKPRQADAQKEST